MYSACGCCGKELYGTDCPCAHCDNFASNVALLFIFAAVAFFQVVS